MMVFYAVPDRQFWRAVPEVYEALRQRLSTTFEMLIHRLIIDLTRPPLTPRPFVRCRLEHVPI